MGKKPTHGPISGSMLQNDNIGPIVDIPKLSPGRRAQFKHMSGHFTVREVLEENDHLALVKLASGETQKFTNQQLLRLSNGHEALRNFRSQSSFGPGSLRPVTPKERHSLDTHSTEPGDMSQMSGMSSESGNTEPMSSDAMSPMASINLLVSSVGSGTDPSFTENASSASDTDQRPLKRRRGNATVPRKDLTFGFSEGLDPASLLRRSTRNQDGLRRSMREKNEDDISSASEKETEKRHQITREHFVRLPKDDPFRKQHSQKCHQCRAPGTKSAQGSLIYCQGCTNAYHKTCLGPRGTRKHLVTKVGEKNFVLQCHHCIGSAHERDPLKPHTGCCSDCLVLGDVSTPFHRRSTNREEQIVRENSGGVDPVAPIAPQLVNNSRNVLLRCVNCQRAFHDHRQPHCVSKRSLLAKGAKAQETNNYDISEEQFFDYHQDWKCIDCVHNPRGIDKIVAWRLLAIASIETSLEGDKVPDAEKEYLIKWTDESYLQCSWMPGSWVWSMSSPAMKVSFDFKAENAHPVLTSEDAIPEAFTRVDIVFDVEHESFVDLGSEKDARMAINKVQRAFVKFKGLGYEDSVWDDVPPMNSERWVHFKVAYDDFVRKFHISVPAQAELQHRLHVARCQNVDNIVALSQPKEMTGGHLMHHQVDGMNWLYLQWLRCRNAILADDMGLGKTIQIAAFVVSLVQRHSCWPFLIVVPNSTCQNWRREFQKWAPFLRVVTYYGSKHARDLIREFELFPKVEDGNLGTQPIARGPGYEDIKAHVVITSYESISNQKTQRSLKNVPWQALIVDEGQRLKNDASILYNSLRGMDIPFKVLLTGTPLQNNTKELFNLLQFLDQSIDAAELNKIYAELTSEGVFELHEMLRPLLLRRTKTQVLKTLPPSFHIIVPLTMSAVQKKVYKSILSQNASLMRAILNRGGEGGKGSRSTLNNILVQLRKTLCHPFVYNPAIEERTDDKETAQRSLIEASGKLQLLEILLPKLKARGHRVLLFSQFLDNLDIIEDFLDELGLKYCRLDGNDTSLKKQKSIDAFNATDSPLFAFLLSTRAGGVGINLATADTVIILDPDFNPHQDVQAFSRAHRIGQKNSVLVLHLVTQGTVEEKIMNTGKEKMVLDHVLIGRMDQTETSSVDVESILRFGAKALFDNQSEDKKIIHDSKSVDRLLERAENHLHESDAGRGSENQLDPSQIWHDDRSDIDQDGIDSEEAQSPDSGIWDSILEERERDYRNQMAKGSQQLGRGQRRKKEINYNVQTRQADGLILDLGNAQSSESEHEDEFANNHDSSSEEEQTASSALASFPPIQPRLHKPLTLADTPDNRHSQPGRPAMNRPIPIFHPFIAYNQQFPARSEPIRPFASYCNICAFADNGHALNCPRSPRPA